MNRVLSFSVPAVSLLAMCGRYANNKSIEQQAARFATDPVQDDITWTPSPNCGPTQLLPIIFQHNDRRILRLATWGFSTDWSQGKALTNARSELAAEKQSFREAFAQRRCLIPAAGYFEWQAQQQAGRKQPQFIRPTDQDIFGMAGLWQTVTDNGHTLGQFTILTTAAAPSIASIHDRMPVILRGQEEEDIWLEESLGSEQVQYLCEAYPDDQLSATVVSPSMNALSTRDWSLLDGMLHE